MNIRFNLNYIHLFENRRMQEPYDQTQVSLKKVDFHEKSNKKIKSTKIVKSGLHIKYQEIHEDSKISDVAIDKPTVVSIKSVKTQAYNDSKQDLSQYLNINAEYSCASILKSIWIYEIISNQPSIYRCQKINRFPFNEYKIIQQQKGSNKQFYLKGNFMGTRYDLSFNGKPVMSIIYESMLNCTAQHRKCTIYGLKLNRQWHHLQFSNNISDLKKLYEIQNNKKNIVCWKSVDPTFNSKRNQFILHFSGKNVRPSVNNSIITDQNGQKILEIYQTRAEKNTYKLNKSGDMPQIWSIAYAISALDFKIAIQ